MHIWVFTSYGSKDNLYLFYCLGGKRGRGRIFNSRMPAIIPINKNPASDSYYEHKDVSEFVILR